MPHRQRRRQVLAELDDLEVLADPDRPGGRLLRQAGMDASYVDLAVARYLEFDYLRWIRAILATVPSQRVLHLGGGAGALARALLADDPASRHELCEISPQVLEIAREHLGLRSGRGLSVRQVDGAVHLARQPDDSWDAIVIDAFVGARVPAQLTSAETAGHAARVAPITLLNVVDDRHARRVASLAETFAAVYPRVATVGRRGENTVLVATRLDLDADRLRARLAGDISVPTLELRRPGNG